MSDLRPSLSPRDYVDPAVYELENERILRASWLPVCRVDQIPDTGDRHAVTLLGQPIVAMRTGEGDVRVFANVCPHRGSELVDDGPGHGTTLICPYHRWAFRLDGTFIGAPLSTGADLDGVCLPVVRHSVWEGFVLVNLSGDAPDPAPRLAGLTEQIGPWRWSELVTVATASFESSWNWKVMVENWIECYHHLGTHRDTLEPFQPAQTTTILPNGGDPWVAMTVQGIGGLEGDPAGWLPGVTVERARDLVVWAAFPLLLAGSISRYAFWLRLIPTDATHHRVTWHLLTHPERLTQFTDDVIAHDMEIIAAVHAEDMASCARVQAGLSSGRLQKFRLTALEAPIADFQRWIAGRLGR